VADDRPTIDPCVCHRGREAARNCPHHTLADYDAADAARDRPTIDPLVQAVAEALLSFDLTAIPDEATLESEARELAEVAVAALVPLIRAQVAEEIRATKAEWMLSAVHAGSDRDRRVAVCTGMECAAALTEGTNRG
jgi:hypothetical protein